MKNQIFKLLLMLSLLIIPSVLLGVGLQLLLGISWWGMAFIGIALQWFYSYWYKHHKEFNRINESLSKYDALEYKQYRIPLTCQSCARENEVELDLTNTEFKCKYCEQTNAIYINFTTAVTTEPLYDGMDFIANAT